MSVRRPSPFASQKTNTFEMELDGLRSDPIELYPGAGPRYLFVQFVIVLILGMNPDELRRTDSSRP